MREAVGWIAMLVTFTMIGVGITSQIIKNYRNKSTEGLSFPFFALSFCGWCVWGAYGWVNDDFFMKIAQTIGAVMTAILLLQFYLYKKRP